MFDRLLNTPETEIAARIGGLQATLRTKGIDAALILQKADLFYYSGTIQQAHLYVPAEGEALLMVNKVLKRAQAESPLSRIVRLASPKKIPQILGRLGLARPRRLGLELDVLPANLYLLLAGIFEGAELLDVSPEIRLQRAVKSPYEIELMREAARYSDKVAAALPELIREGMTEIEL
nr:aminopeptidase P family N-terminal domain-containing protein [Desulfobacterales bacterium]